MLAWLLALSGPALLAAVAAAVIDLVVRDDLTWRGRLGWVGAAIVSPPFAAVAYALSRPFRVDRTLLPTAADAPAGEVERQHAAGPVGLRERVVRQVGQAAVRGLFRSVEVAAPPIPAGPQLWIASHFGAFSDPLVLVHALDRPPRYLAADGLFRVPVLGLLLRSAGAVPVRRTQDGGGAANEGAFSAAWAALAAGEPVGIFPEGIANDTTTLSSLRTGAARIALGAPVAGLHVVPVGIHYEDKAGLRRRVFVDVGHALDVDAWRASAADGGDDRAAVRALTAELEARLREVAPEFVDLVEQQALRTAATVALRTGDTPRPSWGQRADLADALGRRPADDRVALVAAVDDYRRDLEAAGLDDEAVVGPRPVSARRLVTQVVVAALLLPPAVLGAALHSPVLVLAWASGRLRVAAVTAATIRPLVALVGAVVTWSAVTWWLLRSTTVESVLTALAVGFVLVPLWGLAAVVLGERSLLAVRALRRLPGRRRRQPVVETLRAERQRVVELVTASPPAP